MSAAHGTESPRAVMWIDENWCIGCTLCIKACPTDAIMGSNKLMHTVLEAYCTGCELCIPVCPVDCIVLENASGTATGWNAWPQALADTARTRFDAGSARRARSKLENDQRLEEKAMEKLADLPAPSKHTNPAVLDKKRAVIEAALARARAKRTPGSS